jgi:hypothetical protein
MKKTEKPQSINPLIIAEQKTDAKGYPLYPASEDIYANDKEEEDVDPEDISKTKQANVKSGKNNEKDFKDEVTGEDLDVPGNEEDEKNENMGSEDEENNYYSLGGDGNNSLEEDNG